jgi:FkbM family methyltransferase
MGSIKNTRLHLLTERAGFHVRKLSNSPTGHCRLIYEDLLALHQSENTTRRFTIFDIGANVGQSAYLHSKWFPEARILSFEPFPGSFNQLKENVRSLPGVTVENLGFGDLETTADAALFNEQDPADEQNSILHSNNGTQGKSTVKVQLTTLDRYCSRHNIQSIDILKTDTEGYELHVLRGADDLFHRRAIRSVLVEVAVRNSPVIPNHVPLAAVDELLSGHGLSFRGLYDVGYNSDRCETTFANALFKLDLVNTTNN